MLLPGYFVRVRVPGPAAGTRCWFPMSRSAPIRAAAIVLVVNADNVVEQRKIEAGQHVGELRVIEKGLKPDDRVVVDGILRAIPGQKVDPQDADDRRRSQT